MLYIKDGLNFKCPALLTKGQGQQLTWSEDAYKNLCWRVDGGHVECKIFRIM